MPAPASQTRPNSTIRAARPFRLCEGRRVDQRFAGKLRHLVAAPAEFTFGSFELDPRPPSGESGQAEARAASTTVRLVPRRFDRRGALGFADDDAATIGIEPIDGVLADGVGVAGIAEAQQIAPTDGAPTSTFLGKPADANGDDERVDIPMEESLDAWVHATPESSSPRLGEERKLNVPGGGIGGLVSLDPAHEDFAL